MIEPAQPSPSEEKAKATSLASRKFAFEDMINADPRCPKVALKIVRSYLPFITDFGKDFAYRSIIDLQADTALGPKAIVDARKKLVKLRYFIPEGKTGRGTERFRLSFDQESQILDHRNIAREKLREMDTQRKERQKVKRQSTKLVTSETEITNEPCDFGNRRDVTSEIEGEYLDNYLEDSSSEGENQPIKVSSAPDGDPHMPYPVPASEADATAILEKLAAGHALSPGVMQVFRRYMMAGTLTPAMVEQQTRFVA
jgi:hypothetical protein